MEKRHFRKFNVLNILFELNTLPNNSHYLGRYYKFITLCRKANEGKHFEYTESHHILPKSLFPEFASVKVYPENIVKLTYRQHLIAHVMLMKVYHTNNKMIFALKMMLMNTTPSRKVPSSTNLRYIETIKLALKDEASNRVTSEETKLKISISMMGKNKGKPSPNIGKSASEESKKKMSIAKLGKRASEETRDRMSIAKSGENNPNYGKPRTEETKLKISISNKGQKRSEECRENNSKAQKGKKLSLETRQKMSLTRINKFK